MFQNLSSDDMAGLLAFVFMLAFVVLGAAVVAWAFYWDWRKKKLFYEERRMMIEKGMVPPPLPTASTNLSIHGQMAHARMELRKLQFDERRLMIEKGMVPPPEMPEDNQLTAKAPAIALSRGTFMFFAGSGLEIAALSMDPMNDLRNLFLFVAPIIGMVGLGHLVYYLIAKDRKTEARLEKSL